MTRAKSTGMRWAYKVDALDGLRLPKAERERLVQQVADQYEAHLLQHTKAVQARAVGQGMQAAFDASVLALHDLDQRRGKPWMWRYLERTHDYLVHIASAIESEYDDAVALEKETGRKMDRDPAAAKDMIDAALAPLYGDAFEAWDARYKGAGQAMQKEMHCGD